jgi:23S rRNA pseudoU1915 N3-methylase RlmH
MTHSQVVYIVGGAYGVDIDMLSPYIQSVQSLGAWVMPHGLAVLVLLEQIYRARQIAKNT